jgi:hypothetical protein
MSSSPTPLLLLVPPQVLPSEGEDPPLATSADLLSPQGRLAFYHDLARADAVRWRLDGSTLVSAADGEPAAELQLVRLTPPDDTGVPGFEAGAALTRFNWAAVLENFERRTNPEFFLGGHEDAVRLFFDETRRAARTAAASFAGEAVPLIEIIRRSESLTEIAFLGVWLAGAEHAQRVSEALPTQVWTAATPGAGTLVILDDAEAEGRGMREAALGISMMALVFSSQAKGGIADIFKSGPTPVVSVHEARQDGTPLAVKSQKLVQPLPKIYPSGLLGRCAESEHKVVIDINAQRAYLFVEGRLAFETPISSATKGRYTPRGSFHITEKIRSGKHSTLYKSAMPFWMRLDESAIGMHVGQLPGYPASHGCLRMPAESAQFIFDNVPRGTTVQVVDSLPSTPQPAPAPGRPALEPSLVAATQ